MLVLENLGITQHYAETDMPVSIVFPPAGIPPGTVTTDVVYRLPTPYPFIIGKPAGVVEFETPEAEATFEARYPTENVKIIRKYAGESLGGVGDFAERVAGFLVFSLIALTGLFIAYRLIVIPEKRFEGLRRKFPEFLK